MSQSTPSGPSSPAAPQSAECGFCHRPIEGIYYHVVGRTTCPQCAQEIHQFVVNNRFSWGPWLSGLGYGLAAAVGGAIAWAQITRWTRAEWGLLAVVMALVVSKAVVYGAGNRRGRSIQVLTIGLSVLGILIGKGLIAAWVMWPDLVAQEIVVDTVGNRVLLFLLAPVMGFQLFDLLWYAIAVWEGWRVGKMPPLVIQGPYRDGVPAGPPTYTSDAPTGPIQPAAPAGGRRDAVGVALVKTVGSMAVSVVVYWLFLGWQFALGLVLLIFVHEMGHVVALRYYRLNASPPIFIPFLGALINLRQPPPNAKIEAIVGIGGPVAGTVAALGCFGWYLATKDQLALELSYFGFFLNLFNLIPMPPLDGGRVTAAISPWFWILGLGALGAMVVQDFTQGRDVSILLLVLIISLPRVIMTLTSRQQRSGPYYAISRRASWSIGVSYILLLAMLGVLMWYTGKMIQPFGGLG